MKYVHFSSDNNLASVLETYEILPLDTLDKEHDIFLEAKLDQIENDFQDICSRYTFL